MPPYKAERTLIGSAVEPNQKSEVVPERIPGYVQGGATPPDPEIAWEEERPIGANREMHDQVEGQRSFEGGSLTIHPYDGWALAWVLGSEETNTDTPAAGVDEHVLTAKQDGPPVTTTMEWTYLGASNQDDMVRCYVGCFPDSGEISQDNEGIMELSVEHQALGITDDSPRTTFEDVRPLPDRDPWKFSDADSDFSMFGTSFAELQDFSLQFTNGSEPQYYSESEEAPEPYEATYGLMEYQLDATVNATDPALFNELVGPSEGGFSASMSFTKQHSTDEQLLLEATGCRMESAPHDLPESGPTEVDVSVIPNSVTVTVYDAETGGNDYLTEGTAPS